MATTVAERADGLTGPGCAEPCASRRGTRARRWRYRRGSSTKRVRSPAASARDVRPELGRPGLPVEYRDPDAPHRVVVGELRRRPRPLPSASPRDSSGEPGRDAPGDQAVVVVAVHAGDPALREEQSARKFHDKSVQRRAVAGSVMRPRPCARWPHLGPRRLRLLTERPHRPLVVVTRDGELPGARVARLGLAWARVSHVTPSRGNVRYIRENSIRPITRCPYSISSGVSFNRSRARHFHSLSTSR